MTNETHPGVAQQPSREAVLIEALKHAQEALFWHKGEDFEIDGRRAREVIAAALAPYQVRITEDMVQAACEAFGEVYHDDDKDMGDAMRAALYATLAPGNGAVEAIPPCVHETCDDPDWCKGEPECRYAPSPAVLDPVTVEAQRAVHIVRLIELLRSKEGDGVEILCDNPDFNGQPNCAVVCCGDWTGWEDRRFAADTVLDALSSAATEYNLPAPREIIAESNGHHWVQRFNLTCCRDCGIVRRADDQNSACKGVVRVGLRALASPPSGNASEIERLTNQLENAKYLVWSNEHRCWWRPASAGYTRDVNKAGRYSREEAIEISRGRGWPATGIPDEVPVLERDALDCFAASEWHEARYRDSTQSDDPLNSGLCAGGVDPGWDECPKCGATDDEQCAFSDDLVKP